MRPALVVVVDPGFNGCLGFLEGLETMLSDALELEGPHERFDDAFCSGIQPDELLAQPILASEISIELRGVDQRVATDACAIGAVHHRVDVDQAVPLGPHVGRIGRPAHVGAPRDAGARLDTRRAAFAPTTVALPAPKLRTPAIRSRAQTIRSPRYGSVSISDVIRCASPSSTIGMRSSGLS